MKTLRKPTQIAVAVLCLSAGLIAAVAYIKNLQPFRDPTGYIATYNTAGDIDESNPFFQQLGTNGRTCATCHQADQAFGLDASHARQLFLQTDGTDPLFDSIDGANCPDGKKGDATAHSLLLQNGLIRVGVTLPANLEFNIVPVHDPYGCAVMTDPDTGRPIISVYRRPLPSTGLDFLSVVMWDGRETLLPLNDESTFKANLFSDLKHQALDATLTHAQATQPPSDEQLAEIVKFELGLFTAQLSDDRAGLLFAYGGQGGALQLSTQSYYPGINDSLGHDPHGGTFDPHVFTLYTQWSGETSGEAAQRPETGAAARAQIARGELLFNTAPLKITAVRGLNDNPALGYPMEIAGTCTTCHDTPNVGDHSLPLPLDIATSHVSPNESDPNISAALRELDVPDLPIYLITNCPDPHDARRKLSFCTTDPGKGLISGKCSDVNRIKGPILRGLAARAPYFHNGAAATLDELVKFYDKRFQMQLTDSQKNDLIAFLNSL
jgi:cytochrome c peroxidase